jgi:hypothetical protein
MGAERNPYVGPQPFEAEDADRFFGRTREIRDLTSLVVAHRVVLLYSTSGAGKSSLINAGVVPALLDRGYQVLAAGRVGSPMPVEAVAENVFEASLIAQWSQAVPAAQARTIAELLDALPRDKDVDGEPQPRAVVIDQFEEILTAHPEHWDQRAAFFVQLREALDADDRLRLVLALREEYVAQLDPYAELLPTRLRTRFRLERLDDTSAREAVAMPLRDTRRSFAPDAAGELVRNLRRVRVQTADGKTLEVEGEYVEPVQLQVVCQELWDNLPEDVSVITVDHLEELADLDAVLGRFYEEALRAAAERARVRQTKLRRWVREQLITPGRTRSTVYRGATETAGMPNAAVDALEDKRLVRAEERAGAKWYELTHDRLIEPVRVSNERFFAARRRRLVKTAAGLAPIVLVAGPVAVAVALSGGNGASAGTPVPASLGPTSLDFGTISEPSASRPQLLTFSSGSAARRVRLDLTGDSSDFLVIQNTCGDRLAARKTCAVAVRFRPTQVGSRRARLAVAAGQAASLEGTLTARCGVERWSVKTLSDPGASRVNLQPRSTTIAQLAALTPPTQLAQSRIAPIEFETFTVRARLVAMRRELDSDLKIALADLGPTSVMLNAELPAAACVLPAAPALQEKMNAARSTFVQACGSPSSDLVTQLGGVVTVTGVGFFDRRHGASGAAPNGIELHPVLAFTGPPERAKRDEPRCGPR